jgi:hypothetical protein
VELEFSRQIFEKYSISDFMKTPPPPVGAELLREGGRADRQADMTKLILAFRVFVKAPKNGLSGNLGRSVSKNSVLKSVFNRFK